MTDELFNLEQKKAEHFINNETLKESAATAFDELCKDPEKEHFDPIRFGHAFLDICEKMAESCETYKGSGQDILTLKIYEIQRNWLDQGMLDTGELQQDIRPAVRQLASLLESIAIYKSTQVHLPKGAHTYEKYELPIQQYIKESYNSAIFAVIGIGINSKGEYRAAIEFNDESELISDEQGYTLMRLMKSGNRKVLIHRTDVEVATTNIKKQRSTTKPNLSMQNKPPERTTYVD